MTGAADNAETSFAEFRRCFRHVDQISTFHRTEMGSTREIRRASHCGRVCDRFWNEISERDVKAKFRYAILVADSSESGRRRVADLLARASSLLVTAWQDEFQFAAGLRPASDLSETRIA